MVPIGKRVPLACLLLVGASSTNETLDFNSKVNSRFCFFRRECRRRLLRLRAPLDFFSNKVAVSFDIGVRCFFRLENRRRLLQPPRLDLFLNQEALAVVHMIALAVVLRLDMAAVVSFNISVISSWITKKEEITYIKKKQRVSADIVS